MKDYVTEITLLVIALFLIVFADETTNPPDKQSKNK